MIQIKAGGPEAKKSEYRFRNENEIKIVSCNVEVRVTAPLPPPLCRLYSIVVAAKPRANMGLS